MQGGGVRVGCVVGFHEGTYHSHYKASEAAKAVEGGALELDMVMNHGLLKSCKLDEVCGILWPFGQKRSGRVKLRVILETSQLLSSEIIIACVISEIAAIDFMSK